MSDQDQMDEDTKQAKIQALRNLRNSNFYDAKQDNPEGLDLDADQPQQASPAPQQTMQTNPQNLVDALKRKNQIDQLKGLFPSGNGQ